MSLIINELDKTTKIVTKMFGSFIFSSYLYVIRVGNGSQLKQTNKVPNGQ